MAEEKKKGPPPPYSKTKADAVAKARSEKGNPKQEAKRRARTKARRAQSRQAAHKTTVPKQGKVEPEKTKSK